MMFSSIPNYSDHHQNWHQVQQPNHIPQASLDENSQLEPPPPPAGSGGGGSIRPGSMTDRARLAKLPQPEAGLNCPRCDSTNTKFCYFNNYSLTQPRHFCKACRRYWTRGGALRNVPVGGGYRKNKRSSKANGTGGSKSQVNGTKSTSESPSLSSCSNTDVSGHFPFMATLQNLSQYGGGNSSSNTAGFQSQVVAEGGGGEVGLGFQMGSSFLGGSSNMALGGGVDQWRFSFLGGLDQPPTNLYPYENQVKVEENKGINLSRQFMGVSENNQHWIGNQWTEFSGVNSSSTSNLL